jgi:hypothetical protein
MIKSIEISDYQEIDSLRKEELRSRATELVKEADVFLVVTVKNNQIQVVKPGFHPSSMTLADAMLASGEFKDVIIDSLHELSLLRRDHYKETGKVI